MNCKRNRASVIRVGGLLASAMIFAGCADVITYSKDSRRQGLKDYNEARYTDAAGAFRNATRQNPLDYQSYFYLAQSNDQLNQHQQAWSAYKTSLEVNQRARKTSDDEGFRGVILNGFASSVAKFDSRDVEINAIENSARGSANYEQYFLLAKIYAYRGDADSAIQAYTQATSLAPENFDVAKEFGLYLAKAGQNQKAEPSLRRAYVLNSNDVEVVAALRQIGVVPGPSIKPENKLERPIVPVGPIPELKIGRQTATADQP